jgi:cytochrome P450
MKGMGIFVVDGEYWKFQRKMAANIFTVSNFKKFVDQIFQDEMVVFEQVLENLAISGAEVDLHDLFHRYTMDAFAYIAFGVKG